jgi:tetratricopeptide (TPR) repeat protein
MITASILPAPSAAVRATATPSPTWEETGAADQKGDRRAGASADGAINKREPEIGRAWYRLGVSYAKLGKPKDAIPAYLRADAIGQNPIVRYGLGCAYAQLGDTSQAYEWLEKAVASGFRSADQMKKDEDLIPLRGSAHFNALVQRVEWNERPCAHVSEIRQFDFWLGDWQVRSPEGTVVGQNSITVENNDCWIHEHWNGGLGGAGESFNYYNATTKKWHQTWVDDQGEIAEFDGDFRDGAMRLEGYRQGPGESRVPARLTLTPLADGTVRQLGENSMDGGKTWTVLYDLLYSKSKG